VRESQEILWTELETESIEEKTTGYVLHSIGGVERS
jgi:hypothetical protein